jgi:hypothetical protein
VGLRQADIATAPGSTRPYPLGESTLNTSALRIALVTFVALTISAHAINGGLLGLRLQLEATGLRFGPGTARPLRTACTVLLRECHSDIVMPIGMLKRIPPDSGVPLRTAGVAGGPVNRQLR